MGHHVLYSIKVFSFPQTMQTRKCLVTTLTNAPKVQSIYIPGITPKLDKAGTKIAQCNENFANRRKQQNCLQAEFVKLELACGHAASNRFRIHIFPTTAQTVVKRVQSATYPSHFYLPQLTLACSRTSDAMKNRKEKMERGWRA